MNEILQAITLGLVQGFSEFIPVSSSAHLIIAEYYLNSDFTSLAYDVILHLGTLLSLLIYFRRDISRLVGSIRRRGQDRKLLIYIVIATIPAVVFGVFLQGIVETTLRSLWVVVALLVGVALLMFVADRKQGARDLSDLTLKDVIIIGFAQAAALVPGTSRAGSTIVAGSLLGFNNAESARFSFYMAIPILFGANVRILSDGDVRSDVASEPLLYTVGFTVAAVVAYFVIRFLLSYLSAHKLAVFAWYRIALAGLLALMLLGSA